MLGTEPQIVQDYVQSGKVKIVFWPVLNHGNPSVYATLTAECVGQQNPDAFWEIHEYLFTNQRELWNAGRDYFVEAAVGVGVDQQTFEACYDGSEGLATVMALDAIRRERGVFNQPVFDVNGQTFAGLPAYDTFTRILEDSIEAATP